jgi:AcrR family transcriptional regulator
VAAVNYHFGDKERLYEALLRYASRHAGVQPPLVQRGDGAADPAEHLRSFVTWFVSHTLGRGRPAWQAKLLAREMIEPSPALDSLVKDEIQPLFQTLESICHDLLGDGATDEERRFVVRSVIGQCLHYRHSQPVIARLNPEDRYRPGFVRRLSEHITEFSLGGIERLARRRRP